MEKDIRALRHCRDNIFNCSSPAVHFTPSSFRPFDGAQDRLQPESRRFLAY
jgi:hypothetical protein